MAIGFGSSVHNMYLVVSAHNRATRALASVSRDLMLMDRARAKTMAGIQQMSRVGFFGIRAFAYATIAALGGAIYAWSRFDDKMAESLAITEDISGAMRTRMENTAREIAKTTIFSAAEAAEGYFHLLSAGQSVEQSMASLPTVALFAQAGVMDLAKATELLVTSQAALGLVTEDVTENQANMARIANVLARADQTAVGTIEDFAEALTNRAAAAMRTYGIELEEGVAVLAAWAQQGLKGKVAGEAFANVTRDLQKAAIREADAWSEAGLAVFDAKGEFRDMADIIGELENVMSGMSDRQKKQLLSDLGFQERVQHRLLQLLSTSDVIRQFEDDYTTAFTAVAEVAEKQLDSPIKQMILLKNAIVDLFIGAGKEFDEVFVEGIKKVRFWVNSIGPDVFGFAKKAAIGLKDGMRIMGTAWAELTHVGGGFTSFEGNLPKPVENIVDFIKELIEAFKDLPPWLQQATRDWLKLIPVITLASGAIRLVLLMLALLGGPGLIAAAAIAGLVVAFKAAYEESEEFRNVVQGVIDWWNIEAVPALEQAWVRVQEMWTNFLTWFSGTFVPGVKTWYNDIKDELIRGKTALEGIWDNAKIAWANFATTFDENGQKIYDAAYEVWDFIVNTMAPDLTTIIVDLADAFDKALTDINTWWTNNQETISEAIDGMVLAFETLWGGFEGVWNLLFGLLTGDWVRIWEGAGQVVENVFIAMVNVISGALNVILFITNQLINALNAMPGPDMPNLAYLGMLTGVDSPFTTPTWNPNARNPGTYMGSIFGNPYGNMPSNFGLIPTTGATGGGFNMGQIQDREGAGLANKPVPMVHIDKIETKADPQEVADRIAWEIRRM